MKGVVRPTARPRIFNLIYQKAIDCYKITAAVLPYLHHPAKMKAATKLLYLTEKWTRQQIKRLTTQIPHLKGRRLTMAKINLKKTTKTPNPNRKK
ncbi:MAG: hypothetical protein QMD13_05215 [Candidatus Bathyarchaeia archaeon]|nr:hypothetical protein [Candidatus Bathyarchaeia archaeon]